MNMMSSVRKDRAWVTCFVFGAGVAAFVAVTDLSAGVALAQGRAKAKPSTQAGTLRPPKVEPLSEDISSESAPSEPQNDNQESEGAAAPEPSAPAAPATSEPIRSGLDEEELSLGGDERPASALTQKVDPKEKKSAWSLPETVFTIHGYLRMRNEYQNNFFLSRSFDGQTDDPPFTSFRPAQANGAALTGGCGDTNNGSTGTCGGRVISYANMRVRLVPELHLSDYVRIKMWVDALDNMVLGTAPNSSPSSTTNDAAVLARNYPIDSFSSTVNPPQAGRTGLQDSIYIRRAWAEVRPHEAVELRFGRMGWHWGLGMQFNDGADFDGDYSTDVDRVMAITKLAGFYLMGAYDFAYEGLLRRNGSNGLPADATQKDDVNQFMFGIVKQGDPDRDADLVRRGGWTLNGGLMAVKRSQLLSVLGSSTLEDARSTDVSNTKFIRRGLSMYTVDAWGEFRYKGLRISAEGALKAGTLENSQRDVDSVNEKLTLMQMGGALETELRLFAEKMGIYLYSGFASGDSSQNEVGLSSENDHVSQSGGNKTVSTFAFHPNYRVDLILWRNIMRQVTGAYYVKPGVSYDLIRTERGGLLGGRFDMIYSRAAESAQTWGGSADLGLELDLSIYYRSEDGPALTDGFYAAIQGGTLFPFQGLGYRDNAGTAKADLGQAYAARLLLGVIF